MVNTEKPFKNIDQQIEILQSRGLIFQNKAAAKRNLATYGYYEIINGYKDSFMNNSKDDEKGFKEEITFEHIFALFKLDQNFSHFTLQCLEEFEAIFKQTLSYSICELISEKQGIYTNISNYNRGKTYTYKTRNSEQRYSNDRDKLLKCFKKTLNSDFQPYKYYRDEHNNIPPWIMVKNLTFGETIYWFKLSKSNVRKRVIAKMFGLNENILDSSNDILKLNQLFGDILVVLLNYRNLTAHGGRVFSHRSQRHLIRTYSPLFYNENELDISRRQFNSDVGRSSIAAVINSFHIMRRVAPVFLNMYNYTHTELNNYLKFYPEDRGYVLRITEFGLLKNF
ncbi:Abi family protein [Fructilactobacillus frigidiflavus]|uniref:Abi family protein n=1 Tax=Fructilactobacillus frigidiflavus TaxID=3242688 RepID=UPI0037573719